MCRGQGLFRHCNCIMEGHDFDALRLQAVKRNRRSKSIRGSCCWEPSAVGAILDNSAYVGATEGLKSLRVSFKSKKRVPAPKEHRVVVEDTHEPIIDRLVWEKVQTLRQNKRRPTKTGATSIFSGLLCCADCGSKMNLCVSNGYHFFRCGGYKRNSRTKECTNTLYP